MCINLPQFVKYRSLVPFSPTSWAFTSITRLRFDSFALDVINGIVKFVPIKNITLGCDELLEALFYSKAQRTNLKEKT